MIAKTAQYIRSNILPICALATIIIGGYTYFAKADDLKLVAMRLDQKITADKIFYKRQELNQLFRDYGKPKTRDCNQLPAEAYQTCINLKQAIENLQKQQKGGG